MKRQIHYLPERPPFNDCLYITLMKELGITRIATFDKHFNNKKNIKIITLNKKKRKRQAVNNKVLKAFNNIKRVIENY